MWFTQTHEDAVAGEPGIIWTAVPAHRRKKADPAVEDHVNPPSLELKEEKTSILDGEKKKNPLTSTSEKHEPEKP